MQGSPERTINVKHNQYEPDQEKRVYTVKDVATILGLSERHAYTFCNTTEDFEIIKIGRCIRIKKDSFDKWFGN